MTYAPRESAPTSSDKAYTTTTGGGYNRCIVGNSVNRPWAYSVLPNCTGYVHGRWIELGNRTSDFDELSFGNAKEYYSGSNVEKSPTVPKEGAIMVWSNSKSGHVAIVEKIIDENTIYTSESDYGDSSGGTIFINRTRRREWNWGIYPGYTNTFLGFLYHPNITPVETYSLTVVNGTGSVAGKSEGDVVSISATVPKGKKFNGWTLEGSGNIANKNLLNTNFTFGAGNATVTANLIDKKSSNWVVYACSPIYRRN
jgi:surface antigen